jgi:hypothetical protein
MIITLKQGSSNEDVDHESYSTHNSEPRIRVEIAELHMLGRCNYTLSSSSVEISITECREIKGRVKHRSGRADGDTDGYGK